MVNLAAVMAMHPKVLILDEPTAQLDPTVRNDFLVMLQKLHKEFGLTIILTSHNLEDVMEMADQCIIHLNSHFHRFFVWKINLT
ncbi:MULTISPECIES: AAA family ATPase [unclassified Anaerostipes]|nr:AAA family ATPase [Anaerostipes sp. Marseille-Q3525]CUO05019.1 Energy-coupling factor transporter ATP-binding protein EcfA2 [Anaerostipes hadrus]